MLCTVCCDEENNATTDEEGLHTHAAMALGTRPMTLSVAESKLWAYIMLGDSAVSVARADSKRPRLTGIAA